MKKQAYKLMVRKHDRHYRIYRCRKCKRPMWARAWPGIRGPILCPEHVEEEA